MLACYKGICFTACITQICRDYSYYPSLPIKWAIQILWDSGFLILSLWQVSLLTGFSTKEKQGRMGWCWLLNFFISREHRELENNKGRNGSGRWMPFMVVYAIFTPSTGEGSFRQTNKPFFLTLCQEFKKIQIFI